MTLTPEQIADGWLPHDGGECPVDAKRFFSVMFKHMRPTSFAPADCFEWSQVHAYKPEPHP